MISAGDQRVIAFGDAFHSSIQIDHPEWPAAVDHDPEQSTSFRRTLVAELAKPDTIGFGIHFADVVFGRVHLDGTEPSWHPFDQ